MQKSNLDVNITPLTKINSKWIIDINIKHETVKLLEDTRGENLCDFGFHSVFLGTNEKQIHEEKLVS